VSASANTPESAIFAIRDDPDRTLGMVAVLITYCGVQYIMHNE